MSFTFEKLSYKKNDIKHFLWEKNGLLCRTLKIKFDFENSIVKCYNIPWFDIYSELQKITNVRAIFFISLEKVIASSLNLESSGKTNKFNITICICLDTLREVLIL